MSHIDCGICGSLWVWGLWGVLLQIEHHTTFRPRSDVIHLITVSLNPYI